MWDPQNRTRLGGGLAPGRGPGTPGPGSSSARPQPGSPAWRQAGPAASHLHASDSELGQGSAHLGGGRGVVFAVCDDFDQQGVVVGGDDSPLEGGSVVQADAHALSAPEHLRGEAGGLRGRLGSRGEEAAPGPGWARGGRAAAGELQLWRVTFRVISASAPREAGERTTGQRGGPGGADRGSEHTVQWRGARGGGQRFGVSGVTRTHVRGEGRALSRAAVRTTRRGRQPGARDTHCTELPLLGGQRPVFNTKEPNKIFKGEHSAVSRNCQLKIFCGQPGLEGPAGQGGRGKAASRAGLPLRGEDREDWTVLRPARPHQRQDCLGVGACCPALPGACQLHVLLEPRQPLPSPVACFSEAQSLSPTGPRPSPSSMAQSRIRAPGRPASWEGQARWGAGAAAELVRAPPTPGPRGMSQGRDGPEQARGLLLSAWG